MTTEPRLATCRVCGLSWLPDPAAMCCNHDDYDLAPPPIPGRPTLRELVMAAPGEYLTEDEADAMRDLLSDLREARAAIARVRALHRPVRLEPDDEPWCDHCADDREEWSLMAYPCATIRTLDGES